MVEAIFNKDDKPIDLAQISAGSDAPPWQPEPNKQYQIDIKFKHPYKIVQIVLANNSNVETFVAKIFDNDGNTTKLDVSFLLILLKCYFSYNFF